MEIKESDRKLFAPFLDKEEELLWVGRPKRNLRYFFPQYLTLSIWYIPYLLIFIGCVYSDGFGKATVYIAMFTGFFLFGVFPAGLYSDFKLLKHVVFAISNRRLFSLDQRNEYPGTIDITHKTKFRESVHENGVGDVYIGSFKRFILSFQWRHSAWSCPSGRRWFLSRIQPLAFTRIENASEIAALCNELAEKTEKNAALLTLPPSEALEIKRKKGRFFWTLKGFVLVYVAILFIFLIAAIVSLIFIYLFGS